MGNASMGTRGLSAGDWVRLKRLNASKGYGVMTRNASSPNGNATSAIFPLNKDIAPPEAAQQAYNPALLNPYQAAGTHKALRPASSWTDYIASQTADFITSGQTYGANSLSTPAITQTINKVCDGSADTTTMKNKPALPISNQFNRLKILS
jgi:hypothetical protein